MEGTVTVDQIGGEFRWDREKGYGQHQVGYRQETTGVPLPTSAFLFSGWVVPNLYGPELKTFGNDRAEPTTPITAQPTAQEVKTVSPLSFDRDSIYRFAGGDTVMLDFPDGPPERLVLVRVTPKVDLPEKTQVFRGDIYLDPATAELRRMRGQLLTVGGPPDKTKQKVVDALVPNSSVMDVVNRRVCGRRPGSGLSALRPAGAPSLRARHAGGGPDHHSAPGRACGHHDAPDGGLSTDAGLDRSQPAHRVTRRVPTTSGPRRPTRMPSSVLISDLADVGPPRFASRRLTGPVPAQFDLHRFPPVRSSGGTVHRSRRDPAAPRRLSRALLPGEWRLCVVGARVARRARQHTGAGPVGSWTAHAQAILAYITKFADPQTFGPGVGAILVNDNYDYVDRTQYGVGLARSFGRLEQVRARVSVDWVEDHTTVAALATGPLGQTYPANPPVDVLDYLRTRVQVAWNPRISARFAEPGIGASALWEHGGGSQAYDLVQAYLVGRANWKRFTFALVGNAGAVYSANPPTQQLILFGGTGVAARLWVGPVRRRPGRRRQVDGEHSPPLPRRADQGGQEGEPAGAGAQHLHQSLWRLVRGLGLRHGRFPRPAGDQDQSERTGGPVLGADGRDKILGATPPRPVRQLARPRTVQGIRRGDRLDLQRGPGPGLLGMEGILLREICSGVSISARPRAGVLHSLFHRASGRGAEVNQPGGTIEWCGRTGRGRRRPCRARATRCWTRSFRRSVCRCRPSRPWRT